MRWSALSKCRRVELRRRHGERIMRWTSRIISKDNECARNNGAQIVRKQSPGLPVWSQRSFNHCLKEWATFSDSVVFNPDLYCSLKWLGAIWSAFPRIFQPEVKYCRREYSSCRCIAPSRCVKTLLNFISKEKFCIALASLRY